MLYITFPSEESAVDLCDNLVKLKSIACYNLLPIKACYWWEGSINKEDEIVAMAKTIPSKVESVTTWLEENHPYDTPCIIHWEVNVNQKYLDWVKECVQAK